MDEAEQLCDRLVVMDAGRIAAEGSPEQLIRECTSGPAVAPPGKPVASTAGPAVLAAGRDRVVDRDGKVFTARLEGAATIVRRYAGVGHAAAGQLRLPGR